MASAPKNGFFYYNDYFNLSVTEWSAINDFMDRNDPAALGGLIEQNDQLTPDFRRFIADLVTGKIKRPMKKASTFSRDLEIYREIDDALSEGKTLVSSAAIIANKLNRSIDAINKAYYRGKSVDEAYEAFNREEERLEQEEIEEGRREALEACRLSEIKRLENTR
jgi:hypothetical protein